MKTTKTHFIANSGCILGFCMGFSLISGAEVIFHCLIGIVPMAKLKNSFKRRKRTKSKRLGNSREGGHESLRHRPRRANGEHREEGCSGCESISRRKDPSISLQRKDPFSTPHENGSRVI